MVLEHYLLDSKIALIIPCYNEENRLRVAELNRFISKNSILIDFYFVDDGSSDLTSRLIENHLIINNPNHTFLIRLETNQGKGNAIREGILRAREKSYSFYGFIDADLEIPFEQILKLHLAIVDNGKSMSISVRSLYQKVNPLKTRSVISVLMIIIVNSILKFDIPIKDSQCGCKLFRNNIIEICFKDKFESEWLFDLELFLRVRSDLTDFRSEIQEVPLEELNQVKNSNLKWTRNFKILRQLWQINSAYNN